MAEASITKRLSAHLNEVYFVFSRLPKQLSGIAKVLTVTYWRDLFTARAQALHEHRQKLLTTLRSWGVRPAPCTCEEASHHLNDLRHTAKANRGMNVVLERAMRSTRKLGTLVRSRLSEAMHLARSIRENELAHELEQLLDMEKDAQSLLQDELQK